MSEIRRQPRRHFPARNRMIIFKIVMWIARAALFIWQVFFRTE